ncbi:hypothetical protein CcI49_28810 [Frankia sp. CcI49]|uniref:TetR family transcriptional regulator n=1 Tax=Frankia sp. CcI49 TaxID=1745382 RepID=UPI0009763389|nr:TetR family transcriptional regulator [Frankia sp. CcI49]ONH55514.1 hypothetical protein CcI49_28810 [Frankia sp. CcI49]
MIAETENPATPPTRATLAQERRRQYMAREIERAALRLFGERGFAAVSVDDIAAAAGISQRTFFRYHRSKDDILLDYDRRIQDRLLAAFAQRPAGEGAITALRNAYLATSTVEPRNRRAVMLSSRVLADTPVLWTRMNGERAARTGELARLVAARMGVDADADQRPKVVAAAMMAVASAVWDEWTASGGEGDPAERITAALDLLVVGFRGLDEMRPPSGGRS